jgi:hypothetical protein
MTKKLISKLVTLTLFIIGFNIGAWLYHEVPIMRQSYIDNENGMYTTERILYRTHYKDGETIIDPPSLAMDKYDPVVYLLLCVSFFIILLFGSGLLLFHYNVGDFDDFFEKYTDPPLTKFCNWVHRRNNNEEECK